MHDDTSPLENFSGTARLFPLPNLVLFPHVIQPLHIFEPRYRQMTRDALDDDRLLALALLAPGWEENYEDQPEIFPVVCVSHIVAEQELDDGRFNLLVRGVQRARIIEETATDHLYRTAELQLLEEQPFADVAQEQECRQALSELLPLWLKPEAAAYQQFEKLLQEDVPLGIVCDVLTFALQVPLAFKQHLLEIPDGQRRCRTLLERLRSKKDKPFPPDFSDN